MKLPFWTLLLPAALACLWGCGNEAADTATEIDRWEARYEAQADVTHADSLTAAYLRAVASDSGLADRNADYLLRAARVQRSAGRSVAAEELLLRALRQYPQAGSRPEIIQLLASLYAQDLQAPVARLSLQQLDPAALGETQRSVDTATFHRRMSTLLSTMARSPTARLDPAQADEYVRSATLFALLQAQDSLAPVYLFKAAEIAAALRRPRQAVDLYEWISKRYAAHERAGTAHFMQAFLLDEDLQDLEAARQAYTDFLARFAQHELADDAQLLLDNLGKSDEEILQQLEKR